MLEPPPHPLYDCCLSFPAAPTLPIGWVRVLRFCTPLPWLQVFQRFLFSRMVEESRIGKAKDPVLPAHGEESRELRRGESAGLPVTHKAEE